jgi:hypothetical protein
MSGNLMNMRWVTAILVIALAGCDMIPFSGGQLQGEVTPVPAEWSEVASADVIELETNPQAPYSVKLWIIGNGPNLYVHAGANRATWVEHIEADPRVRVLIDGALYELDAQRVTTQTEFDAFSDLYEEKYGRRPRNENVGEAYLFRLLPRSAA